MNLLLVRHGETMWNVEKKIQGSTDTDLNAAGILQAEQLGESLKSKHIPIAGIYTSRQKRAKVTAEIVAKCLDMDCIVMDGLEEMNMGLWEGRSWPDCEASFPEEFRLWNENRRYVRTPNGESYQELLDRFIPALKEISRLHDKDVLVVTHSGNIMALLSYLNDTPYCEMASRYKTQNTSITAIDPARL